MCAHGHQRALPSTLRQSWADARLWKCTTQTTAFQSLSCRGERRGVLTWMTHSRSDQACRPIQTAPAFKWALYDTRAGLWYTHYIPTVSNSPSVWLQDVCLQINIFFPSEKEALCCSFKVLDAIKTFHLDLAASKESIADIGWSSTSMIVNILPLKPAPNPLFKLYLHSAASIWVQTSALWCTNAISERLFLYTRRHKLVARFALK